MGLSEKFCGVYVTPVYGTKEMTNLTVSGTVTIMPDLDAKGLGVIIAAAIDRIRIHGDDARDNNWSFRVKLR